MLWKCSNQLNKNTIRFWCRIQNRFHYVLRKFLRINTYEEIITIGDSPGDVELGKAISATTFLYTHPGQEFKNCEPHFRINDLRELLKVI